MKTFGVPILTNGTVGEMTGPKKNRGWSDLWSPVRLTLPLPVATTSLPTCSIVMVYCEWPVETPNQSVAEMARSRKKRLKAGG